jgi:hypothetical protein
MSEPVVSDDFPRMSGTAFRGRVARRKPDCVEVWPAAAERPHVEVEIDGDRAN